MTKYFLLGSWLLVGVIAVGLLIVQRNVEADHKEAGLSKSVVIARNLVIGDPIDVCSDAYPAATKIAISHWNDFLSIVAFRWKANDLSQCEKESNSSQGISSLIVSNDHDTAKRTSRDIREWHTFYNQFHVHMDPVKYPQNNTGDELVLVVTHELGHVLGLGDYECKTAQDIPTSDDNGRHL